MFIYTEIELKIFLIVKIIYVYKQCWHKKNLINDKNKTKSRRFTYFSKQLTLKKIYTYIIVINDIVSEENLVKQF